MSGNPAISHLLLCSVLWTLANIAGAALPILHAVALNETTIPAQYDDLPLVAKCCGANEVLTRDEAGASVCRVAGNSSGELFSPKFSEYNRTGIMIPGDERPEFVAIVGDPCEFKRYMLYPEDSEEDMHYLLTNGSIFAPHHTPVMLAPGADYCMEVVPELGLRTLVCFPKERMITTANSGVKIYACGLLISVPFLILTIAAYSITPKLRDVLGKALCHYCGCLAVAFTSLAFTQLASDHLEINVCIGMAFVIQFSFVACFFWLNVMCIETWSLVRNHVDRDHRGRMQPKKLFFCYSVWAWSPAAILILVSMAMDLNPAVPTTYIKPHYGCESCWFKSDDDAMPFFYIPLGLVLLGNIVLFVLTSIKLTKYQQDLALRRLARNQESDRLDQRLLGRLKKTFLVCSILFFLMGLNWTMELVSWWIGGDPLNWSAFDLVNALQGVLVFGLFVLRRPPRDLVWYRVQKLRGVDVAEPEVGSMELYLLPVLNGDVTPRQTILP